MDREDAGGAAEAVVPATAALQRIRLRHLTCFVAVAEERTLARAAERLHLSQPAISKTLSELEALAGDRLVERGRAGARLTDAGERFLRYALEVTRALESAAAALARTDTPDTPTVRVGALPTAAGGVLAKAIARLHMQRPRARVRVRTASNSVLLAALKSGEVDFVVGRMAEPTMMQGVSFELLYAESLVVVVRPEHPLLELAGGHVSPLALLDYPLVIPDVGTAPRHHTDTFMRERGIASPRRCTETQSMSVARALTLLADAVWITPRHAAQLDVDRGWLCPLDLPAPGSAEPVGLLCRSGADPGELAGQLMGILRSPS
jgi:DNA-binding transcriptional LysR family regulator